MPTTLCRYRQAADALTLTHIPNHNLPNVDAWQYSVLWVLEIHSCVRRPYAASNEWRASSRKFGTSGQQPNRSSAIGARIERRRREGGALV